MKLSEQAESTILRIRLILDNIGRYESGLEVSEKRMLDIEDCLKFSADWLYKAYQTM